MPATNRALLGAGALLSGCASLVYQVLWVRTLGEILGSTAHAVNTVLAVFFLGLGLGGWIFGRLADRPVGGSAGSIRWFVVLELVIGASGVLFPTAARLLEGAYDSMAPAEWSLTRSGLVNVPLTVALLALPTIAMGGTLPVLVRHVVSRTSELGGRLGWIYGTNTVGAAAGVLLGILVFVPALGLQGAAWTAAGINVLAVLAVVAGRLRSAYRGEAHIARREDVQRADCVPYIATFASGFLSIGLEVLWTRTLAARFLSTVYSYATILFTFLVCLGVGAWIAGWMDRCGLVARRSAVWVFLIAGVSAIATVPLLSGMRPVDAAAGTSLLHLRAIEFSKAVGVMCVPVLLFGLNFPLLCRLAHREAHSVGRELGGMLAANTVGSVLAPIAVGFLLLPRIGILNSLVLLGVTSAVFALTAMSRWAQPVPRERGVQLAFGVAGAVLAVVAASGDLRLWREDPGDQLLAYDDGVAASVAVVQKADGTRTLKVDHSYRLGDSRTVFATRRQGLIPQLLHGDPKNMLFIGMGTGVSVGAAARTGLCEVDVARNRARARPRLAVVRSRERGSGGARCVTRSDPLAGGRRPALRADDRSALRHRRRRPVHPVARG